MTLHASILRSAQQDHDAIVAMRRHIHMYPELSFREEKTGRYIQEKLSELDIPFTSGWAGHGVVGMITGKKTGKGVVALRADMDALPIQEENKTEYTSQVQGVMHACGHDVHTASLLGAAKLLKQYENEFGGTVKLIFQPGEEKLPGGASMMISEGVLDNPVPAVIIGQHVHPQLPAGVVGFRSGEAMGSSDEITVIIRGKGGHGAMPHLTVDPVSIAAQIITGLQTVVSRMTDPMLPCVLTFGKIASDGGAFNVIPDTVTILGTFRTFNETWRKAAHGRIRSYINGVAEASGASSEVRIESGYPVLINNPDLTQRCRQAAEILLGETGVTEIPARLTSEDFAYYSHRIPSCFYRLGVGRRDAEQQVSVHTPTFDIDESALIYGASVLAWLAVTELSRV